MAEIGCGCPHPELELGVANIVIAVFYGGMVGPLNLVLIKNIGQVHK